MMIALYIVLGILGLILFLFCALCCMNAKVRIILKDTFILKAGAGPVMIKVIPGKEEKVSASDYTYRKHKKRLEKERKKAERKAAKKAKKEEEKKLKRKAETATEEEKTGLRLSSIMDLVRFGMKELGTLAKKVRVRIDALHITAGGADAAKTAENYGIMSALMSTTLEFLSCTSTLKDPKDGTVSLTADFLGETTKYDLDMVFSLRIIHVVLTGLRGLRMFIKMKSAENKASKGKEETDTLRYHSFDPGEKTKRIKTKKKAG